MHVLSMIKHTRQFLVKGATLTPFPPKMLKITLTMTLFHQKTHGNPSSKSLMHQTMSSTMSTQPHRAFLGLLDIKSTLYYYLTTQITP